MTREELREKVAKKLRYTYGEDKWLAFADAAIAIVLEKATKVARGHKANLEECGEYDTGYDDGRDDAAAAIRALNYPNNFSEEKT